MARRMSWAALRFATRIEDEAYFLLGMLDVNLLLLYGEGRKAFRRFQEDMIRRSADDSILAWSAPSARWSPSWSSFGVLADSLRAFACSVSIMSLPTRPSGSLYYTLSSRCLKHRAMADQPTDLTMRSVRDLFLIRLNCASRATAAPFVPLRIAKFRTDLANLHVSLVKPSTKISERGLVGTSLRPAHVPLSYSLQGDIEALKRVTWSRAQYTAPHMT